MERVITLELLKQQCVIDPDDDRFDAILQIYRQAAVEKVLSYTGWRVEEVYERWGDIPSAMIHAVLLLVANSMAHREGEVATNLSDVSRPILRLLNPYINTTRR